MAKIIAGFEFPAFFYFVYIQIFSCQPVQNRTKLNTNRVLETIIVRLMAVPFAKIEIGEKIDEFLLCALTFCFSMLAT